MASDQDLARARVLDQQGVRAYREERYNDAIRFFEEARKLGGPPSEIWNIAKCHERLDEPEEAAKYIQEYLDLKGLGAADRAEAEQQLHEIQHRHSTVTISSSPLGGDGVPGGTPLGGRDAGDDRRRRRGTIASRSRSRGTRPSSARSRRSTGARSSSMRVSRRAPAPPAPSSPRRRGRRRPTRARTRAVARTAWCSPREIGVTVPRFGSIGGSAAAGGVLLGGVRRARQRASLS